MCYKDNYERHLYVFFKIFKPKGIAKIMLI